MYSFSCATDTSHIHYVFDEVISFFSKFLQIYQQAEIMPVETVYIIITEQIQITDMIFGLFTNTISQYNSMRRTENID